MIARAVSPCAAEAVARAFHLLGVRSAASCADVAPSPGSFTRWYSRRFLSALQIDATPISFDPFHREMGKVYAYSKSVSTGSAVALQQVACGRITRPASIIQGERLEISRASRSPRSEASSVRRPPYASAKERSPKVTLSISTQSSQGANDARSDLPVGIPCTLPPPVDESGDDSPRTINSDVGRDTYAPSGHREITDTALSSTGMRRHTHTHLALI